MDDLETPLKAKHRGQGARRLPVSPLGLFTAALAAVLCLAIAWVVLFDDPLGGEPRHVVKIEQIVPPQSQTKTPVGPKREQTTQPQTAGDQRTVTIIDGNTGARREVVIGDQKSENQKATQNQPPASDTTNNIPPADKRLIEESKHGPIPKIAPTVCVRSTPMRARSR